MRLSCRRILLRSRNGTSQSDVSSPNFNRRVPNQQATPVDSNEMFGEEFERAGLRECRALFIVTVARIAVEAMSSGINMDRAVGMRRSDLLDIGGRNAFVLFAEMKFGRRQKLFLRHGGDARSVITDGGREAREMRCSRIGERAAPTIADNPYSACFRRNGDRRFNIKNFFSSKAPIKLERDGRLLEVTSRMMCTISAIPATAVRKIAQV